MAIKDWEDDWRIPVLTQDILARIEEEEARKEHTNVEEAGQGETQPREVRSHKNYPKYLEYNKVIHVGIMYKI
jgi:hypothetical protein